MVTTVVRESHALLFIVESTSHSVTSHISWKNSNVKTRGLAPLREVEAPSNSSSLPVATGTLKKTENQCLVGGCSRSSENWPFRNRNIIIMSILLPRDTLEKFFCYPLLFVAPTAVWSRHPTQRAKHLFAVCTRERGCGYIPKSVEADVRRNLLHPGRDTNQRRVPE